MGQRKDRGNEIFKNEKNKMFSVGGRQECLYIQGSQKKYFKKMCFWTHGSLISAQNDQERYTLKAFVRGRKNGLLTKKVLFHTKYMRIHH